MSFERRSFSFSFPYLIVKIIEDFKTREYPVDFIFEADEEFWQLAKQLDVLSFNCSDSVM